MIKYKCSVCNNVVDGELPNDFICDKCGSTKDKFVKLEEKIVDDEIDAIINSIVLESTESGQSKIINDNEEDKRIKIENYNPSIMRINEKCINCGQCKKTCEKVVNIKYDLNKCKSPICIGCGQCILSCPSGALQPKYSYKEVREIIAINDKIVVALLSPAVRVSLGEAFNIEYGTNVEGKIVSSLKKLGFDYVFDTAFGADLTIMEEVSEFISRLSNHGEIPQFTSCCPAWIKYAEIYHPEILGNISTCKSPVGMECAMIKSYFCEKKGFDSNKIVTVAITPCTAKKMEAKDYTPNIDYVLTSSELSLMLKEDDINIASLPDGEFDSILGESSGAGVIFGNTGGVSEAAIRTLSRIINKKELKKDEIEFKSLRGFDGIKTASIDILGKKIKFAVVQQMSNLEELLKDDYYKKFHFIEVMNCKGGCIGGGGQPLNPIPKTEEILERRMEGLYNIDAKRKVRGSYNNKEIQLLYKEYLKKPFGEVSKKTLHTSYSDKSNLLNDK